MNEPKFKVGDKVFTDNIIGEVTDVYYIGEKPRYRIKTPNVEICTFGEGCKIVSLTVQILKNDMQSRLRTKCRMKKYRKNYTRQ